MAAEPFVDVVPRWYRRLVGVFLAALIACGVLGLELFPLSGMRLFSAIRSTTTTSVELVAVDERGTATEVRLSSLPRGWSGLGLTLRTFDGLGSADRDRICDAITDLLALRIPRLERVQVVLVSRELVPRAEGRSASEPRRRSAHACIA